MQSSSPSPTSAPNSASSEDAVASARPSAVLWIAIVLVACVGVFSVIGSVNSRNARPLEGPFVDAKQITSELTVHITGAVQKPGVYTLSSGSRVNDALQKAGGPTEDADTDNLNLAAPVEDGARIEVRRKNIGVTEQTQIVQQPSPNDSGIRPAEPAPSGGTTTDLGNAQGYRISNGIISNNNATPQVTQNTPTAPAPTFPLDLNTATQAQLEALPEIGPKLAAEIVQYRSNSGGFRSVEELDNVNGIGPKTLEALRPLVFVGAR